MVGYSQTIRTSDFQLSQSSDSPMKSSHTAQVFIPVLKQGSWERKAACRSASSKPTSGLPTSE
jgi:hypothetical protein